jgi:taurine dioxygenase
MKPYLEGLTALHDGVRVFGPGTPSASHPVIVRHPASGRKLIYVNSSFTAKINELPDKEGSISFWDNRCTQHYAIPDYWPHVRPGFRVQIEGTAPPVAG